MGPGVPYAIAAKFAYPRPARDRARRRRRDADERHQRADHDRQVPRAWPDQRLIVLVLNNRDLNQVTWEQRAMEGDPKFEGSQDLPDFPYARYAELLGLNGIRVDDARSGRTGLGRGAERRPTGRARGGHRPGGPAAAAAHHDRAGQGAHAPRCSRATRTPRTDHQAVVQAEGPGIPARPMSATAIRAEAPVEQLEVGAYTIPTDAPEADGTLAWDATTIVVVHARGGGEVRPRLHATPTSRPRSWSTPSSPGSSAAATRCRRQARVGRRWSSRPATSAGPGSPRWRSQRSTWRCGI